MAAKRKPSNLGAGLSLDKPQVGIHPAGPPAHNALGQAERAFSAASTFLSGILAISASQFIGAPLKLVDPKFYDGYMAWTKESFAVLVTTMTQWWAPTVFRVTGDDSMKDQLFQMPDGSLRCNFPHRLVMMANHQLYTDWLYLWFVAYTNKMHGRIYIILKESLKNVPIFGWGAQFYNFIFLARKWETDKPRFRRHLQALSNPKDPMWLLIFPEGTNLSATTRQKSKAWAEKTGVPDMKHQLLPRSTGLQFCLQELKETTNWLYDATIAYEGVPEGQFGQDIFTLRSSLFEGRPPKSVNMYWRRFRISDIPIDDSEKFSQWLRQRWVEKDYLLEFFQRHGSFPEGDPTQAIKQEIALAKFAAEQKKAGGKSIVKASPKLAKFITTDVRAGGMEEFMGIFAPIATAATAISSGELTPENVDFDALLAKVAAQQKGAIKNGMPPMPAMPGLPPGNAAALNMTQKSATKPTTAKLTAGQNLDPEVRSLIENANSKVQQRLQKAATPAARKAPNIKNSIPMTPMETVLTRPISTLAMQRGAGALARLGPKVEQGRKAVEAKAQATSKGVPTKVNGTAGSTYGPVRPPGPQRRGSVHTISSSSTTSTNRAVPVRRTTNGTSAAGTTPKTPNKGITVENKTKHPLAGKTISKEAWEKSQNHTTIGQKKVAKA
ncbi:acyltransferase-domain-containing protein [Elsinoe ampelina]|uniref:Acyltransferase-domain-containing protein n=1 Tax=Elsinoe ampelina TaxID=302913 RepID=A0A6A6GQ52_9PEZI|nr:acyltransferase-domain-containing protein [Elsinoe ampelina]